MHTLSPVYPWHIQSSGIFKILAYAKPETYSEPHWYIQNFAIHSGPETYIQNPGLFRTLRYSESEAYSKPCQTSTMEHFEK